MKTAFSIPPVLLPAIIAAYGDERASQIVRACNSALNDKETVKAAPGKVKWNGQLTGGQSYNAKGKFSAKEVSWKESEEFVYTVEQSTAPIEFVKFCGALVALYRRAGSNPSAPLTMAVVPSYVVDWFDAMHAKAKGTAQANKMIGRTNKPKTVTPKVETPKSAETNGQPETASASK